MLTLFLIRKRNGMHGYRLGNVVRLRQLCKGSAGLLLIEGLLRCIFTEGDLVELG